MDAPIDGLLVGGVALGIFVVTHWLLKKRWPNIKWWDSGVITILILFTFWIISFMLVGPPLPNQPH